MHAAKCGTSIRAAKQREPLFMHAGTEWVVSVRAVHHRIFGAVRLGVAPECPARAEHRGEVGWTRDRSHWRAWGH